jgi:hypothetical protein
MVRFVAMMLNHRQVPGRCQARRTAEGTALKLFVCIVVFWAFPTAAQDTPKTVALTEKSNIPAEEISKSLRKGCPGVSIADNATKSDYTLEAIKKKVREGLKIVPEVSFDLTLFDRDGQTVSTASTGSLGSGVKTLCHAIRTSVIVEVVDTQNLTLSSDTRGDTSGGMLGTIVNSNTGRRTHTDASTIYVIVNGEHALLDCYERRTGCATIGPGKYYAEHEGDGLWVNFRMPLTHEQRRNHYRIAGGW